MERIAIRLRRNDDKIGWRKIATSVLLILALAVFVKPCVPGQERGRRKRGRKAVPWVVMCRSKIYSRTLNSTDSMLMPRPDAASAAYKLLTDTKLGALLEELILQGIEISQETIPPEQRVASADVVGFVKHIARNGFVLGISRRLPGHVRIVKSGHADRPEFRRLLEIFGAAIRRIGADEKSDLPAMELAGHTLHRLGVDGIWLAEKGHLIPTNQSKAAETFAVESGDQQSRLKPPASSRAVSSPRTVSNLPRSDSSIWLQGRALDARCDRSGSRRLEADRTCSGGFNDSALDDSAPGGRPRSPARNACAIRPANVRHRHTPPVSGPTDEPVRAFG